MQIDLAPLRILEAEKGIPFETLFEALETALNSAYQSTPGASEVSRVELDRKSGQLKVWAREEIPQEPKLDSEGNPLPLEPRYGPEFDDTPKDFGRIAAMTARNVIFQKLRSAKDEQVLGHLHDKQGKLVSGVIQQGKDPESVTVDVNGTDAVLPRHEQVPGEQYQHGRRLRALATEIGRTAKGPQVTLSRSHPALVKALFALEVPEVADGSVVIMNVAREAGHRSKVAVRANVPGLNAKGACIGEMGARVRAVMTELNGEKIDLIDYSDDPRRYVTAALSPARVKSARIINEATKEMQVVVPDFQLSLAIGKEGQNARLAAKLTGWKIDIKSDAEVPVTRTAAPEGSEVPGVSGGAGEAA
jgi:N utilization substance protein A